MQHYDDKIYIHFKNNALLQYRKRYCMEGVSNY